MVAEKEAGLQAPPVTGATAPETQETTPPTGQEPEEAAPDLQAQISSIQAELKAEKQAKRTLEEKLRSTQANLNERFDRKAEIAALQRALVRTDAKVDLLLEAQQDVSEELPKRRAALKEQQQQEEAQDATQQEAMELRQDLMTEAETAGLDPATAPELQEVRETWQRGVDTRDLRLLRKSRSMAAQVRREAQAKLLEAARKEAEADMKTKLAKAGAFDTASSRQASASGGTSDAEFLKKYAEEPAKHNSPEDHKRAERLLARI